MEILTNKELIRKYAHVLSDTLNERYSIYVFNNLNILDEDDDDVLDLAIAVQDELIERGVKIVSANDGSNNWYIG